HAARPIESFGPRFPSDAVTAEYAAPRLPATGVTVSVEKPVVASTATPPASIVDTVHVAPWAAATTSFGLKPTGACTTYVLPAELCMNATGVDSEPEPP